ncbi:MAG: chain-length determining protein, partial [Vicinamibacterales bacterium]
RMPERPISPNRPMLYSLGAAAGLGLGLFLAAFVEYRDTTMKTEADVVSTLALPVLALIPELMTAEQSVTRARRRRIASWASAAAAAAVVAILAWVWR